MVAMLPHWPIDMARRARLKMIEIVTLMMMIQRCSRLFGMRRKKKAIESLKKHWFSRYNAMPKMLS